VATRNGSIGRDDARASQTEQDGFLAECGSAPQL
jgi:hypothetical protein